MLTSPPKRFQTRIPDLGPRGALQEVLQSLRLVLEMEPDHLDGAIDLLDEAIQIDAKKPAASGGR